MIKIRYSELPSGQHANAESEGKHTVIHLVPGVTVADRKKAIDRLRASARVGHSPKIRALPLALALIADRVKLTLKNGTGAARMHPTGVAIPLVALVAGAALYALLVTGSIRIGPSPISTLSQVPSAALPGNPAPVKTGASASLPDGASGRGPDPVFSSRLTGDNSTAPGVTAPGRTATNPHPSSDPTATSTPTNGVTPPPIHPSPPYISPSPSPSPSPSRTQTGGGGSGGELCLKLGILGICL